MEIFLGAQEPAWMALTTQEPAWMALTKQEPLLPVYVPPPSPSKEKAGIMEDARLPADLFLVYAEEGGGTAPTAITFKK
jgi:hypothetical protein